VIAKHEAVMGGFGKLTGPRRLWRSVPGRQREAIEQAVARQESPIRICLEHHVSRLQYEAILARMIED
jgi:hypothetical protein